MKFKNKKIKKYLIIGAGMAGIVIGGFWWVKRREVVENKTNIEKNYETKEIKNKLETISPLPWQEKAKKIRWLISDWPTKKEAEIYKIEKVKIAEKKIKKALGFEENNEKQVLITENGGIEFYETIEDKEQLKTEKRMNLDELGKRFLGDITKLVEEEVVIKEIGFKRMIWPRWVSCKKREAEAVEILAAIKVDGIEVEGKQTDFIRAIYRLDGRLIRMEIIKLGKLEKTGVKVKIKNRQEIKDDELTIWEVRGSEGWELEEKEVLEEIEISDAGLKYVVDEETGILVPYLVFKGQAWTESERKEVRLGIKATSEKVD